MLSYFYEKRCWVPLKTHLPYRKQMYHNKRYVCMCEGPILSDESGDNPKPLSLGRIWEFLLADQKFQLSLTALKSNIDKCLCK